MRSTVRRLAAGTAIAALSSLAITGFAGAASADVGPGSSGSVSGAASHDEGAVGGFEYDATTVYAHHVNVKGWGAKGSSDRAAGQASWANQLMND